MFELHSHGFFDYLVTIVFILGCYKAIKLAYDWCKQLSAGELLGYASCILGASAVVIAISVEKSLGLSGLTLIIYRFVQVGTVVILVPLLGIVFIAIMICGLLQIRTIVMELIIALRNNYKSNYNVMITVPINILSEQKDVIMETFSISIKYSHSTTMIDAVKEMKKHLQKTYPYFKRINYIEDINSFEEEKWDKFCKAGILDYSKEKLISRGLFIGIECEVVHNPSANNQYKICKYITNNNPDPTQCPIYKSMKVNYKCTTESLNHLYECDHFKDEYLQRPKCKYNQECNAFVRLENGGYRLDDRCHVKLYSHTHRNNRQLKLAENMHAFIFSTDKKENPPWRFPGVPKNAKEGFLKELIDEVIKNGCKYDLCLEIECNQNDDCKHDVVNDKCSLLTIVHEKMNHIKHKQMGACLSKAEMLAFLLYTNDSDCNHKMCACQRNHKDFDTWKWFDLCLGMGIAKLHFREKAKKYKLYSGLKDVKLTSSQVFEGYFSTYTSTSWRREVAYAFTKGEGMIIEFDEDFRNQFGIFACDVSWISKFGESEVLISRSCSFLGKFSLEILDESNGIQTVHLIKTPQ